MHLIFFHVKFSILSSINCPTASSHTKYGPSRVALLHWLSIYLIDILPSYLFTNMLEVVYCAIQYSLCSIRVQLRSWCRYGTLFTWLDKYRVFFHTSNRKYVSSPYSYLGFAR